MVNAPVLNGVAGAMVALLDAVLVTGFDTKTLTSLVALGGVMTATFTGTHSAQPDSVVLVSGVTGGPSGFAGANGEQKVTAAPLPTTRTWATALPDGTYTGTVSIKMAPAGWTKPFTFTNGAVFQSSDPASLKPFLRVDDAGTTSCRVVAYETMTDANTGVGAFPTSVQISGGGYWPKSLAANATATPWSVFADGRTFYFCGQPGVSSGAGFQIGHIRMFGDLIALKPGGDAYACALNYTVQSTPSLMGEGCLSNTGFLFTAVPRAYTGLGSAVLGSPYAWGGGNLGNSGVSATHGAFPNPVDGGLYLIKKHWVQGGSTNPRADFPGMYHVPQSGVWDTFRQGDRAPGAGALAGRTLMAAHGYLANFATVASSGNTAIMMFDATGPWR